MIRFIPIKATLSGRDASRTMHYLVEKDGKIVDRLYSLKDCKATYPTGVKA